MHLTKAMNQQFHRRLQNIHLIAKCVATRFYGFHTQFCKPEHWNIELGLD